MCTSLRIIIIMINNAFHVCVCALAIIIIIIRWIDLLSVPIDLVVMGVVPFHESSPPTPFKYSTVPLQLLLLCFFF